MDTLKVQRRLGGTIIAGGILLAPVFFIVMFLSVTSLVRPSFGGWAWTVPIATEGCFVLLYLLDIRLELARKPMGWLRFTPYPFAAASLWLNVEAGRGDLPGMVGHGVVTVAFFLPLIAGEAAVRRLALTDAECALRSARGDAIAHARDILRAELGLAWRLRTPVLLRRQLRAGRLPAAVMAAIESGLGYGGATVWEPVVQQWVTSSLTQRDKVKASVAQARRTIARAADETVSETHDETPAAQPRRLSQRDGKRDKARRLIAADPAISAGELGKAVGVPRSTAARWKTAETRPRLVAGEG